MDNDKNSKLNLIIEELKALRGEVSGIKERINTLEGRPAPERVGEQVYHEEPPPTPPIQPEKKIPPPKIKTPKKKGEKGSLEAKIGERWLNRIGIVAVVIGMAFFVKYAFDNDWIGPAGRERPRRGGFVDRPRGAWEPTACLSPWPSVSGRVSAIRETHLAGAAGESPIGLRPCRPPYWSRSLRSPRISRTSPLPRPSSRAIWLTLIPASVYS